MQIARRSVELIEEGSTIFLGTVTTVEQMASMLAAFRLRIVTNSLSVFNPVSYTHLTPLHAWETGRIDERAGLSFGQGRDGYWRAKSSCSKGWACLLYTSRPTPCARTS